MAQKSNIKVFVRFKDEAFFAGEDVECTITFENVVPKETTRRRPAMPEANGYPRRSDSIASQIPQSPTQTPRKPSYPPNGDGSRSPLNVVDNASKLQHSDGGVHIGSSVRPHKHRRSVSIISLKGAAQRHGVKNVRSLTQQPGSPALRRVSLKGGNRSPSTSSPLNDRFDSSSSSTVDAGHNKSRSVSRSTSYGTPRPSEPTFQFPPRDVPTDGDNEVASKDLDSDKGILVQSPVQSEPPNHGVDGAPGGERPHYPRAFSVKSIDETPRPSVDIYSHKNDSNETLMSDYPFQATTRLLGRPLLGGALNKPMQIPAKPGPETLIMGYVQLFGSFVLDESLVNSSPFEEVKRRTVVGGQGGGSVVGLGSANGDESFMSAFTWNSISGSIGGMLRNSEQSSIRQMKDIAESKNIPLLSTPKSVLFVNMRLDPGESQSFKYTFPLPRGLPPSHKGRAMKMTYSLVVATQRPTQRRGPQQNIAQVDVPFRVFGGVNDRGESLGHDLMSPYIIVTDKSQVEVVGDHANAAVFEGANGSAVMASTAADFQSYVADLLSKERQESLATPSTLQLGTNAVAPYTPALTNPTTRNLIDQAVRLTTVASGAAQAPSIFTIARASVAIATLSLARSVVKLGDLLFVVVDFSKSKLPCYALEATLESSESVDPSLAIRSRQSVERATRRVWARTVENAVCARRCVFKAQIPVLATPGFSTTGVSLDWCVRVALVVAPSDAPEEVRKPDDADDADNDGAVSPLPETADDNAMLHKAERLLEVVNTDERGTILSAAQRLPCESFEVTIPLRVFGAAIAGGDNGTGIDGLAI